MRKTVNIVLVLLLLLFCWLMLRLSLAYSSMRYDTDFLATKQKIVHIKHWRYAFYTHVFLSSFALMAGLTQFSKKLLKHKRRLHRIAGHIYVIDVLCLAGPSGLIMAFYANGNAAAKLSFVLLSLLWIITTAVALVKAKKGELIAHRNWMIRSYSLTLSAISLRLLAWALPSLVHLNAFDEYTFIAWSSWTLNLVIGELVILSKSREPLVT